MNFKNNGTSISFESNNGTSISFKENGVDFCINSEDLVKSIACIEELIQFLQECQEANRNNGAYDQIEKLLTASVTLRAFWCEHFGKDE